MTPALSAAALPPGASLLRGDREYPMRAEDFDSIAALAYDHAGIVLSANKKDHVYSRLSRRLRQLGLRDFSSYVRCLSDPEGIEERRQMISALTTNVTRFFREPHHFDHFAQDILPGLVETARAGGRVRLWSAGCSSGEEPHSLAFTVLRALPDAERYDIKILASDIDPEVLNPASEGHYSAEAAAQLPAWVNGQMVERGADGIRIAPAARAIVDFRVLNLVRPFPMHGPFDAIFCRNVAIYFDAPTQERLWHSFIGVMRPGSQLYIGHSERPPQSLAGRFAPTCTTGYRLRAEGETVTPERRPTWP